MANDPLPKLCMSAEQATEELAAIRHKLQRLRRRDADSHTEHAELQQHYNAIEAELNKQRLQTWVGRPVILSYTPIDRDIEVVKPRRGNIGKWLKVTRTRALVDFADLGNRKSPTGEVIGPDERISPLDALKAVTINTAGHIHHGNFGENVIPLRRRCAGKNLGVLSRFVGSSCSSLVGDIAWGDRIFEIRSKERSYRRTGRAGGAVTVHAIDMTRGISR